MVRPLKVDEQTIEIIAEGVRAGVDWEVAAKAAGISYNTLHRWRVNSIELMKVYVKYPRISDVDAAEIVGVGEAQIPLLKLFAEQVTSAEAELELELVTLMKDFAKVDRDRQAAQWLLERRYPERWSKQSDVVVHHKEPAIEGEVIDVTELTTRELMQLAAQAGEDDNKVSDLQA